MCTIPYRSLVAPLRFIVGRNGTIPIASGRSTIVACCFKHHRHQSPSIDAAISVTNHFNVQPNDTLYFSTLHDIRAHERRIITHIIILLPCMSCHGLFPALSQQECAAVNGDQDAPNSSSLMVIHLDLFMSYILYVIDGASVSALRQLLPKFHSLIDAMQVMEYASM